MRRALGWMCYRIVMAWPGAWPRGAVACWMLAWAGDYANEPPNAEVRGDRPLYGRASLSTDGLCNGGTNELV